MRVCLGGLGKRPARVALPNPSIGFALIVQGAADLGRALPFSYLT